MKALRGRPHRQSRFPMDLGISRLQFGMDNCKRGHSLELREICSIQMATAVFLLEAVVLMSATTRWSGSWTQRMYGNGQSDVLEGFGLDYSTDISWKQGWRTLEPLQTSGFKNACFLEYIENTLDERGPRLVVMECPAKNWYQCSRPVPRTENARKQLEKKQRETMAPFLGTASDVIKKQLEAGHDFLLEAPLTRMVLNIPVVKDLTADNQVSVCSSSSWNTGKQAWWMTSAPAITAQLDKHKEIKKAEQRIQLG